MNKNLETSNILISASVTGVFASIAVGVASAMLGAFTLPLVLASGVGMVMIMAGLGFIAQGLERSE